MVVNVKVHFDGKVLVLDEPASLPLNTPLVMTVDVPQETPEQLAEKPKRVWGQFRGMMKMSPDFNDELPDSFWLGKE